MRFTPALLCGALLAGCSHGLGSTPPLPATPGVGADAALRRTPSAVMQTSVTTLQPALRTEAFTNYHYSFKGAPRDGSSPRDSLIAVDNALYGTTLTGGTNDRGTAYKINLSSGTETVLHSFGGGSDGFAPSGRLLDVGGTLYGMTAAGGTSGNGTVFKLTPSGSSYSEKVLYNFKGGSDACAPQGGLSEVGGNLVGTSSQCGTASGGTLFEVSPTGSERVLHSFGTVDRSGASDGVAPNGNVVVVNGSLYGTTGFGGSHNDGTIFSYNPGTRAETVLHAFQGTEGSPYVGLTAVNGTLYGTTSNGGANFNGTIFSLRPGGALKTLYAFAGGADGAQPNATLLYANGLLYGTTVAGGSGDNGTLFKIETSGGDKIVLHRFGGGIDGANPAAVIDVNSAIFGTTEYGGSGGEFDDGTVYKRPL